MVTVILLLGVVATTSAFLDSLYWVSSKNNCAAHQFACKNGNCVPTSSRCNENNDCGDGSDEESCGKQAIKKVKMIYIILIFFFFTFNLDKKST